MAKKNRISCVKFSYVGNETDFSSFLYALVKDYITVGQCAVILDEDFGGKVESEKG